MKATFDNEYRGAVIQCTMASLGVNHIILFGVKDPYATRQKLLDGKKKFNHNAPEDPAFVRITGSNCLTVLLDPHAERKGHVLVEP